ncbi:hypothetical protein COU54_04645 [Candidatus Pacearchaeota archaeon CG10_big_fil_rev_8_21_14_0_10_31_24]|nr:MAG: hypothetical protein COU54_04645 [Candidatus Pacearchaeota archaeon CG10_big_fil_rev_8_21_14_0_10_31_24]
MLRIKKVSEVIGKYVYTSEGDYFGQIEEVSLVDNKVDGWRIKVGQSFTRIIGGAKGVVIPHQFVKSIGDIFIVNKASLPSGNEEVGVAELGSTGADDLM